MTILKMMLITVGVAFPLCKFRLRVQASIEIEGFFHHIFNIHNTLIHHKQFRLKYGIHHKQVFIAASILPLQDEIFGRIDDGNKDTGKKCPKNSHNPKIVQGIRNRTKTVS